MKDNLKCCGIVEVYERRRINGEWSGWKLNERKKNLIVNGGYQTIHNRLFGTGDNSAVYYDVFGVSNGTVAPALTRVATDFDADGTTFRKAVSSVSYDSATKTTLVTCFLNSTENTVTSITKFGLFDQTGAGGNMFNEIEFSSAKAKNSDIELFIRYSFVTTQS